MPASAEPGTEAHAPLQRQATIASKLSAYILIVLLVLGFLAAWMRFDLGTTANLVAAVLYLVGILASVRCLTLSGQLKRKSLLIGGIIIGALNTIGCLLNVMAFMRG